MRRLIGAWLGTVLGLAIVTQLPLGISATRWTAVLWAGLALIVVNATVRPLARCLALPLTIISLGLFGWVINGAMLWLVSWWVPGFRVASWGSAVLGAVVLAVVVGGVRWAFKRAFDW